MGSDPALTSEQLRTLEEARSRAERILRATRVASFNGWSLATFGALTFLLGLGSPLLMALGAGLGLVARNELRGRDRLRALDADAPSFLARNQYGLMALVVAYCAWSLWRALASPDPQWALLQELAGLEAGAIQDLTVTGYAAALLLTVLLVGLNARYYQRRAAMLRAFLDETPPWAVAVMRAVAPR